MLTKQETYDDFIKEILNATNNGDIDWKRQNQTTFFASKTTKNGKTALITIQKIISRRFSAGLGGSGGLSMRRPNKLSFAYVFRVQNVSNHEIVMKIDSSRETQYNELLKQLFEASKKNTENNNLDFLKDILGTT